MKKIVLVITLLLLNINLVHSQEIVKFKECVDGDTIKITINNETKTVRLLAVDTPESVHPTKDVEYYGQEASDYTCNLVKNASNIELEYDENSAKEDKYNRLLAWVFVDGTLLQEKLIENGYAQVAYLYKDYKYTSILQAKQEKAQESNSGIWNEEQKQQFENSSESTNQNLNPTDQLASFLDSDTFTTICSVFIIIVVILSEIKKKLMKKKRKE